MKGEGTLSKLAAEYGAHPTMVHPWKKALLNGAAEILERGGKKAPEVDEDIQRRLHPDGRDLGRGAPSSKKGGRPALTFEMRFDMMCDANRIEHRQTKPNHPWTKGQVERMKRTIKNATFKRFHYDCPDKLRAHLCDFMAA